jgi:predicted transcriptional regulator of viral defense system
MGGKEAVLLLGRARGGVLRPRDLAEAFLGREYLRRLEEAGAVERVDRGLYVLTDAPLTEYHQLVEAARRVPHGVICLRSALAFHQLTTQRADKVAVAIDGDLHPPRASIPPMEFFRFGRQSRTFGVEWQEIEGVRVPIYSVAKTIADCFKYRNKLGLEVALEALREAIREHRCTLAELDEAASVCRVQHVMQPYVEALVP